MSDRVVESATAFLDPRSKTWHLPRAQDCWPRCFGMASICHLAWQWRVCETCVKTSKTGSKETKLFWKWHILMKLTCQRPSLWSALGDLLQRLWAYCFSFASWSGSERFVRFSRLQTFIFTSLFFLKMSDISYSIRFNLQKIGAMRLLVATSEVCLCEVWGPSLVATFPGRWGFGNASNPAAEKCTKSQIFKCLHLGVEG